MNLEHVDNKNAAFFTAFVEVVRIWPGQGVLKLRCWQYEDRGSQSWGVGEGGIKGAHDMRIVAPLYKVQRGDVFILDSVYNIRGLLRRKGVYADHMPASCVSVLSSRGTYSVWQHITFMSSSGKASFPSTLGMKAICGTEATSPGNCGLWKSHWITAQVTEACGSLPFLWMEEKKKRKSQDTDDFTSCHIGVPFPED